MLTPARRGLLQALAGLLAISIVAFAVLKAMPGDPVEITLRAWNAPVTPETMADLRQVWALDRPLVRQYAAWLVRFVAGDWGTSFRTGEPVFSEFAARLPLTLTIGLAGLALAVVLAVPLGFMAMRRPGGVADRLSRLLAIFGQAVPVFWLGLVLVWLLGVKLRLITPFATGLAALPLPIVVVALHALGAFSRVYRRDLASLPRMPHFRAALGKGLSRDQALWRHGHGHALYALLSAVRSQAGWVIGGTATVEVVFGLPGISQFLIQSIAVRDLFVLQAYVMVIAVWMIVMNAGLAFALHRIDPRTA